MFRVDNTIGSTIGDEGLVVSAVQAYASDIVNANKPGSVTI